MYLFVRGVFQSLDIETVLEHGVLERYLGIAQFLSSLLEFFLHFRQVCFHSLQPRVLFSAQFLQCIILSLALFLEFLKLKLCLIAHVPSFWWW